MDSLHAAEAAAGVASGPNGENEPGTLRLANLLDKGPAFEQFLTAPRVLAAIRHVIGGDIQLSSLSSRTALPLDEDGAASVQSFHRDWQ